MPFDVDLSPLALMVMWASGLSAGAGIVARWNIVGPGYLWIAGATALMTGGWSFGTPGGAVGIGLVIVGLAAARRPQIAALAFAGAAAAFLAQAMASMNPALALTGALALGGTTCEMLLGHWYLVDPTLPRWALRRLDGAGIVGLAADAVLVMALGAFAVGGFLPITFVGLAFLSILMMVGVWYSLKEKGYEGVMAATGLSYLSVLTALGAVALGRLLIEM